MNKYQDSLNTLFISINNVWRYGNIGMDQLTGYLRNKGFSIDIKYFSNKVSDCEIYSSLSLDYNVYGFSVNSSNYSKCCCLAKKIKEENANAIIVFGGGFPTRFYQEVLSENPEIDYVVLGDGEQPMESLFTALTKGDSNFSHVSIATHTDFTNKKDCLNKEILFFPAFDYYETDSSKRNSRKVHCIQTKNNVCTGNCSFCNERHGIINYKNIDRIVEEIKIVHTKYGVKKFFFTDDNILDPNDNIAKERLKQLCLSIDKLNFKIAFQCYIKAISLKDSEEDRELLRLMKKVGFVEVFVGLESGNQYDLNLYNKHTTVEDNYRTMRLLKENGLIPIIGFISFNPYTTLERISDNFKFLCNVECTYLFNYIYSFVVINKYTSLYQKVLTDGLINKNNTKYIDIDYTFENNDVRDILLYVKENMIPKLNALDYQLDWVTYSFIEHKIWFDNIVDYTKVLEEYKKEDLFVIKKYLGILFIQHDLEKFKNEEKFFWEHFHNRELQLKAIYQYLISLHK